MPDPPASLTRPKRDIWVITLHNAPENRLTPAMLHCLNAILDTVEEQWRADNDKDNSLGGALIIRSSIRKFWSNGFIPEILFQPGFGDELAFPFFYRLMAFPLITIAAISGHCFAGGMLTALSCDFRIMTAGKGWMSMNELLIGLAISAPATSILRARVPQAVWRDLIVAKRWTGQEALAAGIVDELVDDVAEAEADAQAVKKGREPQGPRLILERAMALAAEHAPKVAGGSWGLIKDGMFRSIQEHGWARRRSAEPAVAEKLFWERLERQRAIAEFKARL